MKPKPPEPPHLSALLRLLILDEAGLPAAGLRLVGHVRAAAAGLNRAAVDVAALLDRDLGVVDESRAAEEIRDNADHLADVMRELATEIGTLVPRRPSPPNDRGG